MDIMLITTVLASGWGKEGREQKWKDTKALMDYGFENYKKEIIAEKGQQLKPTTVLYSQKQSIPAVLSEGFEGLFSQQELDKIQIYATQIGEMEAPVIKGEKLGTAEIMLGSSCIAKIDIIAAEGAERYTLTEMLEYLAKKWTDFPLDEKLK